MRAYLGGNPSIASVASAYALFYDIAPPLPTSGTALPPPGTLGSATLGPLDSTTLSTTELVQSTATGTVPIGTLVVRLALEITTPTGAVPLDGRITGCMDMVDFTIC